MKKIVAIFLTALILLSAFSVQSFAAFGFDKIETVEFLFLEEFSLRSIENYLSYYEGEELTDEDRQYYILSSFAATLSNGEVITVEPYDEFGYSQDGKRRIEYNVWVDVYDVLEAAENGSYTVPLHVEMTLYSSIDIVLDEKVIENEISFADKIVESLTLVEGEIKFYKYEYEEDWNGSSYLASDLEDVCFEIEYADGTQVTAQVEKRIGWPISPEYYLDGNQIFIYPDTDTKERDVTVEFIDFEENMPAKTAKAPYESITIDEVVFDDELREQSITYTVTDTKGKEKSYTHELQEFTEIKFTSYDTEITRVYDLGYIYGIPVLVGVEDCIEYPNTISRDVTLTVDGMVMAFERFRLGEVELSLFERIIEAIKDFIINIFNLFG